MPAPIRAGMLVIEAQANCDGRILPPSQPGVSKPVSRNKIVHGYTTALSSGALILAAAALIVALMVTARSQHQP